MFYLNEENCKENRSSYRAEKKLYLIQVQDKFFFSEYFLESRKFILPLFLLQETFSRSFFSLFFFFPSKFNIIYCSMHVKLLIREENK